MVWIGGECTVEEASRPRDVVWGQGFVEPSLPLKIEVHRIGIGRSLCASSLGFDELGVERARQTRDDLILHVEEIGERLIEPLGPKMTACRRVDELHVDPHAIGRALNAAFEHIAHVQFAPDLLEVDRFASIGERRVPADDEGTPDPREVGRQALRHPVDEIILLRVAPEVGERQNDHRQPRRSEFVRGRGDGRGPRLRRLADFERIDPDRLGDVLELGRAEIGDSEIEPPLDLPIGVLRETDRAWLCDALRAARRY